MPRHWPTPPAPERSPAWVVMPDNAPGIKRAAVEGYGARVVMCAATVAAREATAAALAEETGAAFVHPYDNDTVIAGQASATTELLEDVPNLDAVFVPVGGGGLASGACLAVAHRARPVDVYGAEPEGANDAQRSLDAGRLIGIDELPGGAADTIADGLRTSLCPRTYAILQAHMRAILTAPDNEITHWQRVIWERMKLVVEPSAAVPLAALARDASTFRGKRIGVVLSGGNASLGGIGRATSGH